MQLDDPDPFDFDAQKAFVDLARLTATAGDDGWFAVHHPKHELSSRRRCVRAYASMCFCGGKASWRGRECEPDLSNACWVRDCAGIHAGPWEQQHRGFPAIAPRSQALEEKRRMHSLHRGGGVAETAGGEAPHGGLHCHVRLLPQVRRHPQPHRRQRKAGVANAQQAVAASRRHLLLPL